MSLPSEYQEVEYIENTGTTQVQYIDTWVTATANISMELVMTPNTSYTNWEYAIMWTDWTSQWIFLMFYNNVWRYHQWGSYWDISWISDAKTTVAMSSTWFSVNWTSTSFSAWSDYTRWGTILLFTTRSVSTNPSRYRVSKFKMYELKIWDSWTLIRDLVPCYRKSDDVIWLYDLVNDQFYTNSWTWTFAKWPDVIVEWYIISRILWWWPANDGTATNKEYQIRPYEEPTPPTPPALFEIETDFRNYSNISDVYALWWWAWAKGSMSPAVNTSYWFYCSNYNSAWWWCWLYYNISSYMSNAKKITMNLTWTLPAATYQGNESLFLTDTTVLDSTGSDTAPNRLYTSIKWWPYNDVTCIWKRLNWTWSKLYEYWSSTYNWDTDMTWEINLETWVITCTFTQPASISMTYTLTSSELSWVKSTLRYAAFNFTTYTTWLNDTIKTAHLIIE